MKRVHYLIIAILFLALTDGSAAFCQQVARNGATEVFEMKVDTASNIIDFDKIKYQKAYTLDERSGRGMISSFLIDKSIEGIKSLINNRKKKFNAGYSFAIKDETFYDQVSTEGPFDPTGIRFRGFTLARLFKANDGTSDTAFIARFSMDTSGASINELMNNSIFRLKLDTFILKSARVRLPRHLKYLNMDIEISFVASYINTTGQINEDLTVGKFIYTIRKAPLDPADTDFTTYYRDLPKTSPACTGYSFLIPRSVGYYKDEETNKIQQCYGEGLYSIKVAVKESSKDRFIDKLIIYASPDFLTMGNTYLKGKYSPTPPAKVVVTSTTK